MTREQKIREDNTEPRQTEAHTPMLYFTNQSKRLFIRQLQLKCKLELVKAIESNLAENKKFGNY